MDTSTGSPAGSQLLPFQQDLLSQGPQQQTSKEPKIQHTEPPSLLPPAEIHQRSQVRVILQRRAGTVNGQQIFYREQICAYSARINKKCADEAHEQDVCFGLGPAHEDLFDDYAAWIRNGEMPKPAMEPFVSDKERLKFFVRLHSLARYMEDARLRSFCTDAILQMAHDGELNALATEIHHIRTSQGSHGSALHRLLLDVEKARLGGVTGGKMLQKVLTRVGCEGVGKKLEAAEETKQRKAIDTLGKPCTYHKHDGLFTERECKGGVLDGAVVRYPDVPLAAFATGSVLLDQGEV